MIFLKTIEKHIWILASIFIGLIIYFLIFSLDLRLTSFFSLKVNHISIFRDLSYTFSRVTLISLLAGLLAIIGGWAINHSRITERLIMPAINFVRHISPFAWFPFAVIWFGLGEAPVLFVLFVTLYFPALIAVAEAFSIIPQNCLDEARVSGANNLQLFLNIELPLSAVALVNLYRILWGLGWTVVIAAEMLGTSVGLGYRLLDFRYLLFYEEMIVYLILMGVVGVLVDFLLQTLVKRLKKLLLS